MNNLIWYLKGFLTLKITGASPQWALNRFAEEGIAFWDVCWQDDFTLRLCVFKKDGSKAEECAVKAMCDCAVEDFTGLSYALEKLKKRPLLIISVLIAAVIMTVLPQYILFYQVTGNETVETEAILRALDEIGVGFGTPGVQIKPQWVKNHLLNVIEDLEWVTVTQNGCRAQVVVRERTHKPATKNRKGLAHVIATQSGIITEQSVYAGQPLYEVGNTVNKGDILVSGLVDLEHTYAVERAEAEIYARTWRSSEVITPISCTEKSYTGDTWRCVWLQIGDKRIKIFGNSGISTASCDKMTKITEMTLPGDLRIPVSLVVERFSAYEPTERAQTEDEVTEQLKDHVRQCARLDMSAGQICSESWSITEANGCFVLSGVLECHEMIAASVEAAWDKGGVFRDGEDR